MICYPFLKTSFEDFSAGRIDSGTLKKTAAPLGIYEQRDGLFMARIRRTGGRVSANGLHGIADAAEAAGAARLHITTRQDIQVHGIPTASLHQLVENLHAIGFPFVGGGGDTYRNIMACPDSGVASDAIFDVQPCAMAVDAALATHPKAFTLPRKLKIAFFCRESDFGLASTNDLGFAACVRDGRKGFRVACGGGMGRRSALGVELFDFLPEDDAARCALAVTDFFHEHGDRSDRAKARLRFVLERMGPEEFIRLLRHKFEETSASDIARLGFAPLPTWSDGRIPDGTDEFTKWVRLATSPTKFGGGWMSVTLFPHGGDLTICDARALAGLAMRIGCQELIATKSQRLFLPLVQSSLLPEMFDKLKKFSASWTPLGEGRGVVCCVGASVCKIGVLNSPTLAAAISAAAAKLAAVSSPEKAGKLRRALDGIRISGCVNSCAAHQIGALGFQGARRGTEGAASDIYRINLGGTLGVGLSDDITGGSTARSDNAAALAGKILSEFITSDSEDFEDFCRGWNGKLNQ